MRKCPTPGCHQEIPEHYVPGQRCAVCVVNGPPEVRNAVPGPTELHMLYRVEREEDDDVHRD